MSMPWHPTWTPDPTPVQPAAPVPTPMPPTGASPSPAPGPAASSAGPAAPTMRDEIAQIAQEVVTEALIAAGVPTTPDAPTVSDLTKASARSRAFRTLAIGLGISVLWALVNLIAQVAGMQWSDDAWGQVLTLVIGTVLSAVSSYVLRIIKPPAYAADASSPAVGLLKKP